MSAERSEQPDDLDTAVNAAIAACDGDPRATIRALIVANSFLTEPGGHVDERARLGVALDQPGLHAQHQ